MNLAWDICDLSRAFRTKANIGLCGIDWAWTPSKCKVNSTCPDLKVKTRLYNVGPTIAKLVQITPISMVYDTRITMVNGIYKPAYNWGAPHCRTSRFEFDIPVCEHRQRRKNMWCFSPAELLLIYRHFFIFTSVTKQDPESQVWLILATGEIELWKSTIHPGVYFGPWDFLGSIDFCWACEVSSPISRKMLGWELGGSGRGRICEKHHPSGVDDG